MNKSQAETKVYAFHTVFRVDIKLFLESYRNVAIWSFPWSAIYAKIF